MVLTTYLDSAVESDPFGPTQLDILVCGSRFHTGSSINCFSWWRQRFQAVPFKLLYCCILLFSCFLFPIYLWCILTFRNQLSELFQSVVRSSVLIYLTVASGSEYRNHRRFDSFRLMHVFPVRYLLVSLVCFRLVV